MKGGFYDISNLAKCNDKNLCKDEEKDTVINIYNKFLDKVFLEPDELNLYGEIGKQELAYNEVLEKLKKNLGQKDETIIINLYSVYKSNKDIETSRVSLMGLEKKLSACSEKEIKGLTKILINLNNI